jgi:hypothetical protein
VLDDRIEGAVESGADQGESVEIVDWKVLDDLLEYLGWSTTQFRGVAGKTVSALE